MQENSVRKQEWVKAIALAALFLFLLFFIVTRSSCTNPGSSGHGGNGPSAESVESTGNQNGSGESNQDGAEANPVSPDKEEAREESLGDTSDTSDTSTGDRFAGPEEIPSPANLEDGDVSSQQSGHVIGGLRVKGERLGVILDISGSMSRYLDDLREEINSKFKGAMFLEVEGCLLEASTWDPRQSSPASVPGGSTRERHSVMNAFRELVELHQVDSIYWFCDLQDRRTDGALDELRALIGGSDETAAFHLYIRSTDRTPDDKLKEIVRISDGAFEQRRQ